MMRVVKFKDGKYGIRRSLFGEQYINFQGGDPLNGYTPYRRELFDECCKTSKESAVIIYTGITQDTRYMKTILHIFFKMRFYRVMEFAGKYALWRLSFTEGSFYNFSSKTWTSLQPACYNSCLVPDVITVLKYFPESILPFDYGTSL